MLPDFLDLRTVYLIAHVFGAVLGAGGAFMSDAMFFNSVKDGMFDRHELRFMHLGGKMVWAGVAFLVLSGILLVSTNPEFFLASQKFLVKATIVGIIILNGIIFHLWHLPQIKKNLDVKFSESPSFLKNSSFLLASGAISMTSWISTVILGMLKSVPYSYSQIFAVYFIMLCLAVSGALVMKNKILSLKP